MLCYRDKAFCFSDCTNAACHRFLSDEVTAKADAFGLPLALSDFSGRCGDYEPPAVDASCSLDVVEG